MATLNHLFDHLPEQICHVQCGFCTTILLVSVPFSSLSMVVTVRCGHCTSLLSVNMMKASFIPLHLLSSLAHDVEGKDQEAALAAGKKESQKMNLEKESLNLMTYSDSEDEDMPPQVVPKPPAKRQRAPSAYNCFIKEEIRRLKAQNPNMAHKEAFSLAAKNWAHFPPTKNIGDADDQCFEHEDDTAPCNTHQHSSEGHEEGNNGFRERKAPRYSIRAKSPFD